MKMRQSILFALVLLAGCASTPSDARSPSTNPSSTQHAECLVCKMNFDLACVDVDVDKNTPSYVYNGKTYYFCSEECRDKFAKNPDKYAGR